MQGAVTVDADLAAEDERLGPVLWTRHLPGSTESTQGEAAIPRCERFDASRLHFRKRKMSKQVHICFNDLDKYKTHEGRVDNDGHDTLTRWAGFRTR